MLKVLLLVMAVIIGVLGYKVYSDSQKVQAHHVSPQSQDTTPSKQGAVSSKAKQVVETEKIETDDVPPLELDEVAGVESHSVENNDKEANEIGEELQNRSYEEIRNDTSLSEEEREMMIMDKIIYEDKHNPAPPSEPLSEEEMEKMMLEDFAYMQELEKTNK